MNKLFTIIFSLFTIYCTAQITNSTNTVGLLYADPDNVAEGYMLYTPQGSNSAYLVNNCGELVNEWTFSGSSNYSGCYLTEDGSCVKFVVNYFNSIAVYGDGCFEKRDWNNNLVWQYCGTGRYKGLHSDLYPLPNGNFLALVQDQHTTQEAIENGVRPQNIGNNGFKMESVVEFMPIGLDDAEVVWEWHTWDHVIQDFDDTKLNYGVIADHPELYDINMIQGNSHYNSIYYHPEKQQIVMSSWLDNEIYIIDHSTTTEEAAGSTGGIYGKGGDFLFRWGNPSNYDANGPQRLSGQHNPKWIQDDYPNGGMISIFNNGWGGLNGQNNSSAAVIIDPDPDNDGVYDMDANGVFLPDDYHHYWAGNVIGNSTMYSSIMSGVDVQANGNIAICEATRGRLSEVTLDGDVVWVYQSPDANGSVVNQGQNSNSGVYKLDKYKPTYPGLIDKDLCAIGLVENENVLSDSCAAYLQLGIVPIAGFDYEIDNIGNSATVSFTNTTNEADEYWWTFGNGFATDIESPDFQFFEDGTYEVCLVSTNCFGTDTSCQEISFTIVGLEDELTQSSINIYPNPVNNVLHIEVENTNEVSIEMFDLQGRKISVEFLNDNTINTTSLNNGYYFIEIVDYKTNEKLVKKILKQ